MIDWCWVVEDLIVDVVIELIGGIGVVKEVVMFVFFYGKQVIIVNKDLVVMVGIEFDWLVELYGGVLIYEVVVVGGILIICMINEGLVFDWICWVSGIFNGISNYIFIVIDQEGFFFDVVLKEV